MSQHSCFPSFCSLVAFFRPAPLENPSAFFLSPFFLRFLLFLSFRPFFPAFLKLTSFPCLHQHVSSSFVSSFRLRVVWCISSPSTPFLCHSCQGFCPWLFVELFFVRMRQLPLTSLHVAIETLSLSSRWLLLLPIACLLLPLLPW